MALGIGLAVAGVASLAGGALQADAAKSAANTQAQAGQAAVAEQKSEFAQNQKALQPYQALGTDTLSLLRDALGIPQTTANTPPTVDWNAYLKANPDVAANPYYSQHPDEHYAQHGQAEGRQIQMTTPPTSSSLPSSLQGALVKPFNFDISQDPGYQFRLDQGTKAIENSAAAKGTQLSGATMKELLQYGSDYASGEFNAAFQRDQATKQQLLSTLTAGTGIGTGATNTAVSAGTSTAANVGNTLTGIGNAQASGTIGTANAISGGLQGVGQGLLLKQAFANTNPGVSGVNAGVNLEPGPG